MTAKFAAQIDYGDPYVQPLILAALRSQLPATSYKLIETEHETAAELTNNLDCRFSNTDVNPPGTEENALPLLQILPYESLSFPRLFARQQTSLRKNHTLFNAYTIRKALIRKHYLSNTIHHHVTKNPSSALRTHFPLSVHFELDYAEFLDEALVDAFELREAFARNEERGEAREREWWILKPGMSDGGQGIRLFSTEGELRTIFESWEGNESDVDEESANEEDEEDASDSPRNGFVGSGDEKDSKIQSFSDAINASHLRHFLVQPYIHPPLLISDPPFCNRKFHIRTYVVAAGALSVYVYGPKLALFASEPYRPPWESTGLTCDTDGPTGTSGGAGDCLNHDEEILQRIRNIHLTNTCMQSKIKAQQTELRNVFLLSDLPLALATHTAISEQINTVTSELFRAALAQPTNFQPSPHCFEVFGLDFIISQGNDSSNPNHTSENSYHRYQSLPTTGKDRRGSIVRAHLLEVNAFPDFAQTGAELQQEVVGGLWEEIVHTVIARHFNVECDWSNWATLGANNSGIQKRAALAAKDEDHSGDEKYKNERQCRLTNVFNLDLGFQ